MLALAAAAVVGVVPALKATGARCRRGSNMRPLVRGSLKFGGVWTVVIVAQIALTVIFLLSGVSLGWNFFATGYKRDRRRVSARRISSARLEMDPAPLNTGSTEWPDGLPRPLRCHVRELERRLLAEARRRRA